MSWIACAFPGASPAELWEIRAVCGGLVRHNELANPLSMATNVDVTLN